MEVAFPELSRNGELRGTCPSESRLWECCLVGKGLTRTSVWLQHLQACRVSQGATWSIFGNLSVKRQHNLTVLPNGKGLQESWRATWDKGVE